MEGKGKKPRGQSLMVEVLTRLRCLPRTTLCSYSCPSTRPSSGAVCPPLLLRLMGGSSSSCRKGGAGVSQHDHVIPKVDEVPQARASPRAPLEIPSPTPSSNARSIVSLTRVEKIFSLLFYGVLLDPPTRESRTVVPPPEVDIEMVPSPEDSGRAAGGEDVLNRVSIPKSPLDYFPEVEAISVETSLDFGEGNKTGAVGALSGVAKVLVVLPEMEAVVLSVGVNEALVVLPDARTSLPFTGTIPTSVSSEVGAEVVARKARGTAATPLGWDAIVAIVGVGETPMVSTDPEALTDLPEVNAGVGVSSAGGLNH